MPTSAKNSKYDRDLLLEAEMANMSLQQKPNQFEKEGESKNQRLAKKKESGMNGILNHGQVQNSSQDLKEEEYRITKNKNDRFVKKKQ